MPTNYDRAAIEMDPVAFSVPISYSTLSLLDSMSHADQIEVYRLNIETVWDAEFATPDFSRDDIIRFGVIKPEWITFNEANTTITAITIPALHVFTKEDGTTVYYPQMSSEQLRIKRKVVNSESLVTWVTGSRITANQLNLVVDQLISINQENLHDLEYNVVLQSEVGTLVSTVAYVDSEIADLVATKGVANGIVPLNAYGQINVSYLSGSAGVLPGVYFQQATRPVRASGSDGLFKWGSLWFNTLEGDAYYPVGRLYMYTKDDNFVTTEASNAECGYWVDISTTERGV